MGTCISEIISWPHEESGTYYRIILNDHFFWAFFIVIKAFYMWKFTKKSMGFICFSHLEKKDISKIIYSGLCVCCCTRIIVKNNILNIQLKDFWGEDGNCVSYIKREKESMNIMIALQDSLEAVTWLILWGCLMLTDSCFFLIVA